MGDWKKVQAVAHIISSCPSQASSLSHYYATISPQVTLYPLDNSQVSTLVLTLLQLLRLLKSPMAVTVQVAAATISLMMKQQPALARTLLLDPLTRPLKLLTTGEVHTLLLALSTPATSSVVQQLSLKVNYQRICKNPSIPSSE